MERKPLTQTVLNHNKKVPFFHWMPEIVKHELQKAVIQETMQTGEKATMASFVVEAIIDRIGRIRGRKYAEKLYQEVVKGSFISSRRSTETIAPPQKRRPNLAFLPQEDD